MTELWRASSQDIDRANLTRFIAEIANRHGTACEDYAALHHWSIQEPEKFWSLVWDFTGVICEERGQVIIEDKARMPGARFFPDARLNFARNLLRRRDDTDAIIYRGENGDEARVTWRELHEAVSTTATALRARGIKAGDRVCAVTANIPEVITAMLASVSIGAIWSSCSPDFGLQGILDRLEQISPKVLFAVDGYHYNGNAIDVRQKIADVAKAVPSVETLISIPFLGDGDIEGAIPLPQIQSEHPAGEIEFESLPFNHPLYILFSSGTTGKPKCIVHGAGGTLLQHLKEQQLHIDLMAGDRFFYFTTCGWMMWNYVASVLASEATALLYDGSPFHPDGYTLFDFADAEGCTQYGMSAKFIQAIEKYGVMPNERYALDSVRLLLSTGSVLPPEGFDYVYKHVKPGVCLSSITGGTDLIGCFVGGDPTGVVYRGELQVPALGMAVEVFNDAGTSVVGEKGELVCTRSFPSMPIEFWNDDGGKRYRAAYFERFPDIWTQGDYAEFTEHGSFILYGRSDATLNPGGVRIGTAEIYRQVELFEEVVESVAIGQEWQGDTRVVLFVVLQPGLDLDEPLAARLREQIKTGASPRHVPARMAQVTDIPRTRSGKLTELAIRDVIHGRNIKNVEAIANPEALEQFRHRPELAN